MTSSDSRNDAVAIGFSPGFLLKNASGIYDGRNGDGYRYGLPSPIRFNLSLLSPNN